MEKNPKILRILVPSIGGQGGGVVTEIISSAIVIERERIAKERGLWDSISMRTDLEARFMVPGLAQRSGSVFTSITCVSPDETDLPEDNLIFSERMFPSSVDVMVTPEVTEAMKFIRAGHMKRDSTVIASEHRFFTTVEKMPSHPPYIKMEDQVEAIKKVCQTYVGIDATEVTKRFSLPPVTANIILLGILYQTKALPVSKESYIKAIETVFQRKPHVIESNKKAFELGEKYSELLDVRKTAKVDILQQSIDEIIKRNSELLKSRKKGREVEKYKRFCNEEISKYPDNLRLILCEAVGQLLDYDSWAHVEKYMEFVKEIYDFDSKSGSDFMLTQEYAKHMAGRMFKWEGPFEVARLKIMNKPEVKKKTIVKVEALLQPNLEEVYGMVPLKLHKIFTTFIPGWENFIHKHRYKGHASAIDITSLHGFMTFKMLAVFRSLRKHSVRYSHEMNKIRKYTDEIKTRAQTNHEVGVLLARYMQNIKGFAHIREQNFRCLDSLLTLVDLGISIDQSRGDAGYTTTLKAFNRASSFVTHDGEGLNEVSDFHKSLKRAFEEKDFERIDTMKFDSKLPVLN